MQQEECKRYAVDLEWTFNTGSIETDGKFKCGSWYDGDRLYGTLSCDTFRERFVDILPESVELVGHNIVSDLKQMVRDGNLPANFRLVDSLLAARLLYPDAPTKELKPFAREFGLVWENEVDNPDLGVLLDYCGKDTFASWYIAHALMEKMSPRLRKVFDVNCDLSRAFLACEVAGMKLDKQFLEEEERRLSSKIGELAKDLPADIVTNDFVFRDWIRAHYTEKELLYLPRTDKGELSVNVKGLKQLRRQSKLFKKILEAREQNDYRTLYVLRPLRLMGADGFFTPQYKLLVAKTHRRSTEPAIQNWPASARRAVVSRFPGGKILALDFKNLEARLFAWQAGCKKFLDALVEGGYPLIAERCFGWEKIDKKDPRYRMLKALVLAVTYNMSEGQFIRSMQLDHGVQLTWNEARQQIDNFFTVFPEIYAERERRKQYAHTYGRAFSDVGAEIPLRELPEEFYAPDEWKWKKKSLENRAVNYPTQCLAAYVTGCALIDIQDTIMGDLDWTWRDYLMSLHWTRKGRYPKTLIGFPIAEVHDELVFDVNADGDDTRVQYMEKVAHSCMVAAKTLKTLVPHFDCPLDVEAVVGDYWKKD